MKQIKTIKGLASHIAKLEGKKSQARIGDIREILGIISDAVYVDKLETFWHMFYYNGKKRAQKREKKCRK